MVTTLTVSSDPEQLWQRSALKELEQALGQDIDLWHRSRNESWEISQTSAERSNKNDLGTLEGNDSEQDLFALMDSTATTGIATVLEKSPGTYLLVIPFGSRTAGTTTVRTQSPGLLLGLAELGSRFFQQQAQMAQVREENDFFLKQVSDDFEELTFLRSMAQRLGLGDQTKSVEQLVKISIAELGKSTHAEELHYIANSDSGLELLASWHADGIDVDAHPFSEIVPIVLQFRQAAEIQPVIKNAFGRTELGSQFFGVRDIVVVTVGNEGEPLGWFLAINRVSEEESVTVPEWRLNQHEFGTSEASLLSTAAAMISSHESNLSLFQERELLLVNVVRTLVSAVEAKDQYTCGHSERVALYAKRLAQQVGYNEEDCELLYLTGLLHDIGKIAINDAILKKPGRLTDEEFAEIQRHPDEGWNILQSLHQLDYVLPGVLHHHERMDGKGYPDGLADTDIPLDGRILAVADAYDAMTSDRAYRHGDAARESDCHSS